MSSKLDPVKQQIIDAYQNKASLRLIAKAHGCSAGTVRTFLNKEKVLLRKRGRPTKGL